ncbi:hypothetical protein UPYG_G00072210 [Umbra pygmaea]|uniref:Immunoglobulin domain-containing protein n=1 Tax=Umbra pygmaea TaxID=75934 RepID=A0ABD0XZA1_UMBPY
MTRFQIVLYTIFSATSWMFIVDGNIISGYQGRGAEIKCHYDSGYESYNKYLCNKDCDWSNVVIETSSGVSHVERNRFSLHDDRERRVFTVNISNLTMSDAGTYWCGVSRTAKDIYVLVNLQVVKDWCCDNPTLVQGTSPGPVRIRCPYEPQHKENEKYFCIGSRPSTCLQQALITSRQTKPEGIFLHDNKTAGVFTVTITGLTKKDSGMYMCGIRIDQSLDVYSLVSLEINETATTTSIPSTTTLVTTVTRRSPSSSSVTLQSLPSLTNSTSMLTQVTVIISVSVIVAVLVLLFVFIIIYKCTRKTIPGSAKLNKQTELKEKNNKSAIRVKLASCKNPHSFNPENKESAEQTRHTGLQEDIYQNTEVAVSVKLASGLQKETGMFEDIYVNTDARKEVNRKPAHSQHQPSFPSEHESMYYNTTANKNYNKRVVTSKRRR